MDRDEFEKARDSHMSIFSGGEIVRATQGFKRHWQNREVLETRPNLVIQMDEAAKFEFGFSITELQKLFGEAINIGETFIPP